MNLFTAKLDAQGKTLDLLSERQKVLAGNIANADTPGYQARDFDFAQALAQARGGQGGETLAVTEPGHLSVSGAGAGTLISAKWAG